MAPQYQYGEDIRQKSATLVKYLLSLPYINLSPFGRLSLESIVIQ